MKTKKILSFTLVLLLLVFILVKTDVASGCIKDALFLCAESLVPSLFPFFVMSGLMVRLGMVSVLGKILSPFARILFKTSGKGAVAFVIGIICGYPTGAKVIGDMYKEKSITKSEAERLLAFCNNSGPLFIIGAIGTNMLHNHSLGVALYVIHFLSAVVTGIFLRNKGDNMKSENICDINTKNIGRAISESIESAVGAILNVCGYVLFFSLLCGIAKNVVLVSLLEVTTGAKTLITCGLSDKVLFILLSAVVGFGGVCVLFQVQSAVFGTGLSLKLYIFGKIFQAAVSSVMAFFYVNMFLAEPVFATVSQPVHMVNAVNIFFLISVVLSLVRLTKKG